MARGISGSFTWTSEEIYTKTGFYVGPASPNPSMEEISYLVIRVQDEKSSKLCQEIERMSKINGGIIINSSAGIERGFSSDFHTGLFHENCRCRLIVKPRALYRELDVLDYEMAAGSTSLSYNAMSRAEKNLEISTLKSSVGYRNSTRGIMLINSIRG